MKNGLLLSGSLMAMLVAAGVSAQSADEADVFAPAAEAVETVETTEEAAENATDVVETVVEEVDEEVDDVIDTFTAQEAAPAATTAAPAPSTSRSADYDLELHELEDRLNELKESVFASKARLRMLWHQLMQERIGGSRVVVVHINDLGGLFDIERITYALDGDQVHAGNAAEDETVADNGRVEVYDSPVLAGPHTIVVQAELVGNAHGLFSYMEGYSFSLVSSHSFTIEDGKTAEVDVRLFDHGGASRALEDRPDVSYEIEMFDTVGDDVDLVGEGEGS